MVACGGLEMNPPRTHLQHAERENRGAICHPPLRRGSSRSERVSATARRRVGFYEIALTKFRRS